MAIWINPELNRVGRKLIGGNPNVINRSCYIDDVPILSAIVGVKFLAKIRVSSIGNEVVVGMINPGSVVKQRYCSDQSGISAFTDWSVGVPVLGKASTRIVVLAISQIRRIWKPMNWYGDNVRRRQRPNALDINESSPVKVVVVEIILGKNTYRKLERLVLGISKVPKEFVVRRNRLTNHQRNIRRAGIRVWLCERRVDVQRA